MPRASSDASVSDVQKQVDSVGFGRYQYLVLLGIGIATLVEAMEMGIVSPLHTALARVFELSRKERAILPMVTYMGSMGGMVIAGPLADLWGRKRGLLTSLVLVCLANCIQAALPPSSPFGVLVLLRVLTGLAGAIGVPTGISLAVESCPSKDRLWMVFAITFMGSLGYLIEAVGLDIFMPHFGEEASDNWRGLCLFCGVPAAMSLPLVLCLRESPTFLAINGRWHECIEALDALADWNGAADLRHQERRFDRRKSTIWRSLSIAETCGSTLSGLALHYLPILVLLIMVDALRSFFTSGSAYLCKDLFELTRLNKSVSPTSLNIIASCSPLVGLIIGQRFVWAGVRTVMFGCTVIAAAALVALSFQAVRGVSWLLLALVLVYKLTYGPMNTCVSLMKVEAFPTEFRATAFAAICTVGKLLCALGPTLVEALKKEEAATSWTPRNLAGYLFSLAGAVLLSGILAVNVPVDCCSCSDEGLPLKDFSKLNLVTDDENIDSKQGADSGKPCNAYGSIDTADNKLKP